MILQNYDLQSLPPLHSAAAKGDTTELAQLLDFGANIEDRVDTGLGFQDAAKRALTPLMVAAGSVFKSTAAVHTLLKYGANPRALSDAGVDALWYAAGTGDPERVATLLAMGGDPHAVSSGGLSVVAQAARSGSPETLRLLLNEGASPHPPGGLTDYDTVEGEMIPLFAAATSGSGMCVQMLLEHGVDATARDSVGHTALMYAGGPAVILLLIAAGCPLDARDPYGWSALDKALVDRNAATTDAMRAAPDVSDMRVLEPAIQRRQASVVAGLIDAGADLEARDEEGRTVLLRSCQYQVVPALLELLIARGADIHARDSNDRTALHLGAWQQSGVIRILVNAGIPVDARDVQGRTPLHYAIENHGHEAINVLLDLGADIEARTTEGMTPLMIGAGVTNPTETLITLLLTQGANPRARSFDGRNARDIVVERIAEQEARLRSVSEQSDESGRIAADAAGRRLTLRRARTALIAVETALGQATHHTETPPPVLPEPIWIGYQSRPQRLATEYWGQPIGTEHIAEVCCFGHATWMTGANFLACFTSERAIPKAYIDEEGHTTATYAYRAYPLLFDTSGVPRPLKPSELLGKRARRPRPPVLEHYTWLGYDVTECTIEQSWGMGCSPLSPGCNSVAYEMGTIVNRYCLVDDLAAAYDLAILFGVQQPEPGPYIIVEVWRRTSK
jgi:ankyrin repeat protein